MNTREFLGLHDALATLRSTVGVAATTSETVAVAAAIDRVVAHDIRAPIDVPPFEASAMDGYAVHSMDPIFRGDAPYTLEVGGESRAGAPFLDVARGDRAIRIFTGAVMPAPCDSVVIQEDVERSGGSIRLSARPRAGANVRVRGHDVSAGAALCNSGDRLGAFDLAWLTACGLTTVAVRTKVRVALFSTGDELRNAGEPLASGQIYDANRFVLQQLLRDTPVIVTDLGILPDDPHRIEATLRDAAANHDAVLTSGGVSVGDADYVRTIVERLGAIEFWKIAIKPGKPFAYGRIGGCRIFGLPGNPVSTIVTFLMLVKPILWQLAGGHADAPTTVPAVLGVDVAHDRGRVEYQRGTSTNVGGRLIAKPTSDQGSNRIGSFRGANCLIEIPRDSGDLRSGDEVDVLPLTGLLS